LINLHGFFNRHVPPYCEQYMEMVRHDHEIVNLELPGRHIRTQYVNQEHGVALRLQQSRTLDRLRGGEKRTSRPYDPIGARIASRFRHSQGLKAQPLYNAVRHDLKSCPGVSTFPKEMFLPCNDWASLNGPRFRSVIQYLC
jgi:hypothetical protein